MFWRTGYDSRFSVYKRQNIHNVMNNKQTRRVSSKKIRALLNELANEICSAQDRVTLSLTGNTFEIHLEGATVNITVEEKGGAL